MSAADDHHPKEEAATPLPMDAARPLHWVFKIGNRAKAMDFFREELGLRVLRHEEFAQGCQATCNGPYNGRWSKTMAGYGAEDDHFVLELTYNYGVGAYRLGDDFRKMSVAGQDKSSAAAAKELASPDGYKFSLEGTGDRAVREVELGCRQVKRTVDYWKGVLGAAEEVKAAAGEGEAVFSFAKKGPNFQLRFKEIGHEVDIGTAFGRVAFSVPTEQLPAIEARVRAAKHTVLTPLTKLDTPGKAQVQVVILADPDGYEICFVGDEGFRQLSQTDPKAGQALDEAMEKDKSDEWFTNKGEKKEGTH